VGRLRHYVISIFLITGLASPTVSQTYNPFNQRDDTYTLLGLKRARQAYETARAEFERQQNLFDRGLISSVELEQSRNIFTDAEVNYQQSLLTVLFEEQYITVSEAVKYRAEDGSKRVRLTLENTSTGSAEFQKLVNIEDELFRSLQPDVIPNVYVSILNSENSIISRPYEAKISELRSGDPAQLDFALLQDLNAVTVFMIYGNGNQRTMKIFLQKDESEDRVLVQSEQFSQEVELGSSTSYDLSLELFSGTSNTFALEAVNLPEQIGRFFKDPTGQVRLKQVKFTESSRAKPAALEVMLPDRPSDAIVLDNPISFFVLVVPPDRSIDLASLRARSWTEEEIRGLNVGYVGLELVPRGKGDIMVRIPQLYRSIDSDEPATLTAELVNEGSHRLDNVELDFDLPLNWTYEVTPDRIEPLEIGRESRVSILFQPPADIAPGKYNIRIRTSAVSNGEPIAGEDKTVTVEVQGRANLVGTTLILIVLIGVVLGIVVFGIKLSRK
jgi:uncharacterized membrane protein